MGFYSKINKIIEILFLIKLNQTTYKLVLRFRLKSTSKYLVLIRLPSIGLRNTRETSGIRNVGDPVNFHLSQTL